MSSGVISVDGTLWAVGFDFAAILSSYVFVFSSASLGTVGYYMGML